MLTQYLIDFLGGVQEDRCWYADTNSLKIQGKLICEICSVKAIEIVNTSTIYFDTPL